jgi:hypothetical protein
MTNDTYLNIYLVSATIINQITIIKEYEVSLKIVLLYKLTTHAYINVLVFTYMFTYFMIIYFMLVSILYDGN